MRSPSSDNPPPDARLRLLRLLRERSLKTGDFVLASGERSTYYIDARATTMTGRGQLLVGEIGHRTIVEAGWEPEFVGGMTLGADPVAYAIAAHATRTGTSLDAFSVRKRAKGHGAGRRIEGCLRAGARVAMVDDTITTGGSVLEAAEAVVEHGARVVGILVLVDREEGARERLADSGYELRAVFRARELLASS